MWYTTHTYTHAGKDTYKQHTHDGHQNIRVKVYKITLVMHFGWHTKQ